ncbi:hypothetical protein G6M89_20550 [Natronolimnobius sp. AArcel1]|uniref:hypothetical protein n=1 Tax=Natronolimnobius sp. AArcel1 TaxID=1679093 RepID=UPI0013EA2599|nr:hypothetical protein [Natronolimnobius sp. AArcel1]NGM71357.1 hypothetical protein [Natronolimnobius sp. AArcel1]
MKSSYQTKRERTDQPTDSTDYKGGAGDPIGFTADGQPVVGEPGDGQLSTLDVKKDEGPTGRVIPFNSANTTFNAQDAWFGDQEKYDRLWKYHHKWDNDDSARRTHRDKVLLSKSLGNALGLSSAQRDRVVGIVINLNGRQFNQYGGITALALGAIAYIGDQDAQSMDERILGTKQFNALCDQHVVDGWAACKKVKEVYRKKRLASPSENSI